MIGSNYRLAKREKPANILNTFTSQYEPSEYKNKVKNNSIENEE